VGIINAGDDAPAPPLAGAFAVRDWITAARSWMNSSTSASVSQKARGLPEASRRSPARASRGCVRHPSAPWHALIVTVPTTAVMVTVAALRIAGRRGYRSHHSPDRARSQLGRMTDAQYPIEFFHGR
jgi:hypothetical protein